MGTVTPSRTKKSSYPLIVIAVVLVVVIFGAVALMSRGREDASPEAQRAYVYMRSDLEGLITAQTLIHRMTGRFATDADQAGQLQTIGVDKPVITVSGDGWVATVTSSTVPKIQCAVGVGAPNPLDRSAGSGSIVCH